ncbi:MAG: Flp pilus assembly protein CpaB [Pontiellaceae bacterium]|nr:Flp pilus assembly protein CpaB [Pontiellaceae bacterium]MBN2784903.1 Flp pilus assembly protein CpaB [Pontiellaceae bacterium]
MKNKLILVIALLLAGLAFWLNLKYLSGQRQKLADEFEAVEVIVADHDMGALTVLTPDDLAMKQVVKASVGQNFFRKSDVTDLIGKKLLYPVRRGDPILWTQVDMPNRRGVGLSSVVEKGKRAISLSISGAPGVSGLVQPNDHVDILGTFSFPSVTNPAQVESVTLTLMQNVTVIAAGASVAGQGDPRGRSGGYSTITFSVTPREAEILVFAQQTRGQLYLSLRNPADRDAENNLQSVNFDYIESVLKDLNERRQQEIHSNPL